jgi:hypothetical protein
MAEQTTETGFVSGDAVASPTIHDLAPLHWLVTHPRLRADFLRELPPEKARSPREILQCVSQLEEETGWAAEALLRFLGCPTSNVGEFRSQTPEEYKPCRNYVHLLRTLTGMVEVATDKRMLILGFGGVYLKAGGGIDKVWEAFAEHLQNRDALLAIEYLELGEIHTALNTALTLIDPSFVYSGPSPFDGLPAVHISTGRLDTLVRNDPQELGFLGEKRTVPAMRAHIEDCEGCGAAFLDRRSRLEPLQSSELNVSH